MGGRRKEERERERERMKERERKREREREHDSGEERERGRERLLTHFSSGASYFVSLSAGLYKYLDAITGLWFRGMSVAAEEKIYAAEEKTTLGDEMRESKETRWDSKGWRDISEIR